MPTHRKPLVYFATVSFAADRDGGCAFELQAGPKTHTITASSPHEACRRLADFFARSAALGTAIDAANAMRSTQLDLPGVELATSRGAVPA